MEPKREIPIGNYIRPKSIIENIPVTSRAGNSMLRKDEKSKLITKLSSKVRLFNLGKEEDLKDYTEVLDQLGNSKAELRYMSRHWCPETKAVFVYMEWVSYVIDKDD